jgi:ribosomal protein L18E
MHEKFECNLYIMDKIETEEIHGVTYAHVVSNTEENVVSWIVEYRISSAFDESQKWKETRAYREMSRRASKAVPKIKKSALRDELVILPGVAVVN